MARALSLELREPVSPAIEDPACRRQAAELVGMGVASAIR